MRTLISLVIISLTLSIAGCKLLQVKGEVGGVEIEAKTEGNKEGKFCPPGQAKKGNC